MENHNIVKISEVTKLPVFTGSFLKKLGKYHADELMETQGKNLFPQIPMYFAHISSIKIPKEIKKVIYNQFAEGWNPSYRFEDCALLFDEDKNHIGWVMYLNWNTETSSEYIFDRDGQKWICEHV